MLKLNKINDQQERTSFDEIKKYDCPLYCKD